MTDEILFEQRGAAGFIILNRPKALNALNHPMVTAMAAKLDEWDKDDSIRHVVVTGAGEKAFCAGGDIRKVYEMKKAGEPGLADFFGDEYVLNARIKAYPKPYISLIDGIVMGGGVGLSVHGRYRAGSEFTLFAMPETGIGFFPDVGGGYFLPRLPHFIGTYCALSAGRLKQADTLAAGILTHAVPRESMPALAKALETTEDVEAVLASFHQDPGASGLMAQASVIESVFSASTVAEIMSRLDAVDSEWAQKTAADIRAKSPTSVHLALEQVRRGADLDFNANMRMEYRIVSRILQGHDFFEGVRAVLVDKDHAPDWQPAHLDQVDSAEIASYFQEPEGGDLALS
ncbi:enoyl-CoA hydratase/isomerase family protein [Roseibium litorale]|uniref:enoyl-CoA hydratase/isomerase family protein n=1 Tax=Roseibium litorale TaxID=2803841 RepID=UPI001FEA950E|nr:enoyl-CoA hydratase/isomerase family protein [Roseibium litorale]